MCKRHKQSVNKLANCWQQIELASILANFFANFFVFNQSKRALLTWFICEPTLFKFIEAVHNCPAVWNGSSLAYKTRIKTNKTKRRSALTNRVSSNLSISSLFLCFSVVRECYYTLKRPRCKLPFLLCDTSLTCEGKSLSTFRSFPTRVCQLKFAVQKPLKTYHKARNIATQIVADVIKKKNT